MTPTIEDYKLAIIPDVVYEDSLDEAGSEYDDEAYDKFVASANYEFVDSTSGRGWESYVIRHKESQKFYKATFWYSSWEGVSFDEFEIAPVEVTQQQVTTTKWV